MSPLTLFETHAVTATQYLKIIRGKVHSVTTLIKHAANWN